MAGSPATFAGGLARETRRSYLIFEEQLKLVIRDAVGFGEIVDWSQQFAKGPRRARRGDRTFDDLPHV